MSMSVEAPLRAPQDEIAAARVAIFEGGAAEAAARLTALIQQTGPNHALSYWQAAALGAAGDSAGPRLAGGAKSW